jgi:two-component system sensor histidine kinase CpxA
MFRRMRVRLSIPTRLLAGFFANLALLGLGFWLVFRAQFGSASNQIFAGIAEPRVQALAERVSAELRAQSQSSWDRVLAGHTRALGVDFSLYNGDLRLVAGPEQELPEEMTKRVRNELTPHALNRPEGRPPPPPDEPSFFDDITGLPPGPREGRPARGGPFPGAPEPPPMDPDLTSYPKVTAHTWNPSAYWVVARVPVVQSERGWLPLLLVMRSTSLTAGGLFFDPKPWLYAGLGVLVVSALIWAPLALGLTRSLWRLRTATGRIAEGDFAVDVPDAARADELGELGRSVKQMAQRLEGHVTGQKRLMGDIAHELCSPIARMQASLGILEQIGSEDEKQRKYLGKVSGELQHMSTLVNELLSFSKAGLVRGVGLLSVKLEPLVQRVLEREEANPGIFRIEISKAIEVRAEPDLLARAVGNLVRNALRYAAATGVIEILAMEQDERVFLVVRDHGPGVPEEALPRLFDPFYRPDAARTRESGGVGLGLAIVKSCVEACRGTVAVRNREDGGLEVSLLLHSATKAA